MPQFRRFCIYCGGTGMSKEHLWPDWLAAYVPRTLPHFKQEFAFYGKTPEPIIYEKHKTGDPHATRLRIVCETCNRGWMSRLQTEAKPILVRLLLRETTTLLQTEQRILARWAAVSVATGDQLDPYSAAVPQEDRDFLRTRKRPPSRWRIWLGHAPPGLEGVWIHTTAPVNSYKKQVIKIRHDGTRAPNTQSTTFVVGHVMFCAISSTTESLNVMDVGGGGREAFVAQLWPYRGQPVSWPLPAMPWDLAERIAGLFSEACKRALA
jgi:hypothetical protein